mmetsp:Transcript_10487/g.20656  ORF Transcript_10487/g.20656 Transcript_10487/m.20656 type:complete len:178 (-) Transcript_10487:151-684(-)
MQVYSKGNEVVRHSFCSLFNTEFTTYSFGVSDGRYKWDIKKRYSDFAALDKELTKCFPKSMLAVTSIPGKAAFGSMSPSLINKRQKELDLYLKAVLARPDLANCSLLVDFLDVPLEAALDREDADADYYRGVGGGGSSTSPRTELSNAPTSVGSSVRVRAWQQEAEAKWGERESAVL